MIVKLRQGEHVDDALRALKHKIATEGTMEEVLCRRRFENPREKKKRKERQAAAKAKAAKFSRKFFN